MAEFRKTIGIFPSGKEFDDRIDINEVVSNRDNVHKAEPLKRRDFHDRSNDGVSPCEVMDDLSSGNEVRASLRKRRKIEDSSSPGTSTREATDELSSFSNEFRDGTDTDVSSPILIPPPPTVDDIDRWSYHIDLQEFGARLQAAARAVFPNERKSRYFNVSVLMLSWEDEDPRLPVSQEVDTLQEVFRDVYHFDTERWEIPGLNSHYKLAEKIMQFVKPEEDSNTHLKIVYYAGHARLMETRTLAWTSWQNQKKAKCAMVKWGAIQSFLEEAANDTLILLDCCASGTANTCEGNGTTELISACAWNETANGVGPYSLTSALVIELKRLSQKVSFSVGELYRNVFMRTQNRMPEDIPQRGRERERHPAPIHLVLTQDTQLPRSIQLSVISETDYNVKNQAISRRQNWEQSIRSVSPDIPVRNHGKSASSCSNTEGSLRIAPSNIISTQSASRMAPRLAFAIRLSDTFRPDDEIRNLFLEWLREIPTIAQEVNIESSFDSYSTLLVISLPVSMAAYLPPNHAIISLGPIISGNRISHAELVQSLCDTSLKKPLDLDSSGPVMLNASLRGSESEQNIITRPNPRPSPTSSGMRKRTNTPPDLPTILASTSARGGRLDTHRSLPIHPRALTIEAALKDCVGLQVKSFALIVVLENGDEKTYTSPILTPQQPIIFTNKFRQDFRRSMRRATAESYRGDSSYESDNPVIGDRPWNRNPDPYGDNDDTPLTALVTDHLTTGYEEPNITDNRRRRRARGPGSYADNDDTPIPVPIEPKAQIVTLGDDAEVEKFYSLRFKNMQQQSCKIVGEAFIKLVEPKKRMHYPYTEGEAGAPPWWPKSGDNGVRHKEPNDLLKPERIRLLVHILKMIVEPHENQYPAIRKLGLSVQKLEEVTMEAIANWFRRPENAKKKPYLKEIFKIARGQERYKAGELDYYTQVRVICNSDSRFKFSDDEVEEVAKDEGNNADPGGLLAN